MTLMIDRVPGLYFEAFPYSSGVVQDWESTVHEDIWHGMTPIVAHPSLHSSFNYSSDASFGVEIPGFDASRNGKYIMRWRGHFYAERGGTYEFKLQNADGSRLYVDGKMVVDNDGHHSDTTATGTVFLRRGSRDIVIVRFKDTGVSPPSLIRTHAQANASAEQLYLNVSVGQHDYEFRIIESSSSPDDTGSQSDKPPIPPPPPGLHLEVYHRAGGTLQSYGTPLYTTWGALKPFATHRTHAKDVWYSNDNQFKADIPGFKKNDQYILRFSGMFTAANRGAYQFKTRSDDGSQLWIDEKLIVNNDGDHGPTDRTGRTAVLAKGTHQIVITFYEYVST